MIFDKLFGSEDCDHEWMDATGIKSEINGDIHGEELTTITEIEMYMRRCIHCDETEELSKEERTYLVTKTRIE